MFVDLYWSVPTLACYDGEGGDAGGQAVGQAGGQAAGQAGNQAAGKMPASRAARRSSPRSRSTSSLPRSADRAEAHFKAQNKTLLEEKESRINELLADKSLTTAERDRLQGDYAKVQDQLKDPPQREGNVAPRAEAGRGALNSQSQGSWKTGRRVGSPLHREHDQAGVARGGRQT